MPKVIRLFLSVLRLCTIGYRRLLFPEAMYMQCSCASHDKWHATVARGKNYRLQSMKQPDNIRAVSKQETLCTETQRRYTADSGSNVRRY